MSFVSLLFNMRGGLRTKLAESDFLELFLDNGIPRYDVVGLPETHDINDSFDFPGYTVFAEPRRIGGRRRKGGVAFLLSPSFTKSSNATRLADDVPPETVALSVNEHIFGSSCKVALVLSYITRRSWKSHKRYTSATETSLYTLLKMYLLKHRNDGYSVLLMGDLNGCTGTCGGWSGQDPLFSYYSPGSRISDCENDLDRDGEEILQICEASECRILNGLTLEGSLANMSCAITRPAYSASDSIVIAESSDGELEELKGTVIDYCIGSTDILSSFATLSVLPITRFSDHCPVTLVWNGHAYSQLQPGLLPGRGISAVLGWSISNIPGMLYIVVCI